MKKREKITKTEVEVCKKYFPKVKITGEGILKFGKGQYIYKKKYGYCYVPFHKRVEGRFSTIEELENFFKTSIKAEEVVKT